MKTKKSETKAPLFAKSVKSKPLAVKSSIKAGEATAKDVNPGP